MSMDLRSSPEGHDSTVASMDSEAKRRKLRKGTHSCWECKRRKTKCTFATTSDATCISCRRRGTACVNQEFSEGEITANIKNPMVRVEALITQLVNKIGNGSDERQLQPKPSIVSTPDSVIDPASERTPKLHENSEKQSALDNDPITGSSSLPTPESLYYAPFKSFPHQTNKYAELSKALYAAFPSQEDGALLCRSSTKIPLYFYQINMTPHSDIEHEGSRIKRTLSERLGPTTHPVLLARQMLVFASLIQRLPAQYLDGLSEAPQVLMKRLTDTAINLVTTNEELHGTTEGIECIILEGVFQATGGNLRRAWLAFRRALMVGQLMGINRLQSRPLRSIDPVTKIYPQYLWFRIIYMDRFLSMMLGFPQGNNDISMGSDAAYAADTPIGKLTRTHAVISSRILERKDRESILLNFTAVKEIDMELLKAAKSMPAKFWLPPNFVGTEKDSELEFWETMRLVNQLNHSHLVCQLHLPYLLRCGSKRIGKHPNFASEDAYNEIMRASKYSKMACGNAARDILTRCVTYSSHHVGNCCWFFAVPASLTLVLAHLDCHRNQEEAHMFAHQRLSDRVMMEQFLEIMENMEIAKEGGDEALSDRDANLLRWLLSIEAEVADGQSYTARNVQGLDGLQEDGNALRINIPYFGVIKISRDGVISKEYSNPKSNSGQVEDNHDSTEFADSVHTCNYILNSNLPNGGVLPHDQISTDMGHRAQISEQTQLQAIGHEQFTAEQFSTSNNNFDTQQQHFYPGLTAGIEDWAFQGVDNAFFDNLMMGTQLLDDNPNWLPEWQSGNSGGT